MVGNPFLVCQKLRKKKLLGGLKLKYKNSGADVAHGSLVYENWYNTFDEKVLYFAQKLSKFMKTQIEYSFYPF